VFFPGLGFYLGLKQPEGHFDAGFQDKIAGILHYVAVVRDLPYLFDEFFFRMGGKKDQRQWTYGQEGTTGLRTV